MWTSPVPLYSLAPAMKIGSPYTKFFKKALQDMNENGEVEIYRIKNTKSISTCFQGSNKGKPLGFFKLASLFIMLICGITISLLIRYGFK